MSKLTWNAILWSWSASQRCQLSWRASSAHPVVSVRRSVARCDPSSSDSKRLNHWVDTLANVQSSSERPYPTTASSWGLPDRASIHLLQPPKRMWRTVERHRSFVDRQSRFAADPSPVWLPLGSGLCCCTRPADIVRILPVNSPSREWFSFA